MVYGAGNVKPRHARRGRERRLALNAVAFMATRHRVSSSGKRVPHLCMRRANRLVRHKCGSGSNDFSRKIGRAPLMSTRNVAECLSFVSNLQSVPHSKRAPSGGSLRTNIGMSSEVVLCASQSRRAAPACLEWFARPDEKRELILKPIHATLPMLASSSAFVPQTGTRPRS